MSSNSSCQILIAGADVTGLSCAYHLKKQGFNNIALAPAGQPLAAAEAAAGLFAGGQLDNFTRVSHAHGEDFAARLWQLGDCGYSNLSQFCRDHDVAVQKGYRLRLIVSETEAAEAEKAVRALRSVNPAARIFAPARDPRFRDVFMPRVLAVQDEGLNAALIEPKSLLNALQAESSVHLLGPLAHLETSANGVYAVTAAGDSWHAEIIILACHLQIRTYVPSLSDALVSVADQWGTISSSAPFASGMPPGTYWTANHTYEWGGIRKGKKSVVMGGGRYLRPMAGIDAQVALYEEPIAMHLESQLQKTFTGERQLTTARGSAGLDCRPCDELPLIGPMFGNERILIATGFMGSSLSMGFQAGKCLAELIADGKSPTLPRRLWPERLRTLGAKS